MHNKIKTLDVGCGEGQWLEENGGSHVVGVDVNLFYLKLALRKAKKGTHFQLADALHLPFKEKSFKEVYVTDVLHHLSEFGVALDEINRILNGRLEITESVNDNILFRIGRQLIKNWRGMPIKSLFTSSQLGGKIRENFIIDKVEYYSYLPISYIFFYFGFKSRIMCYINQTYNDLLRSLRLANVLVSRVKIIAYNINN